MSQDDIGYGFIDEDESIEHHGVKGMKWGVRKRRPTGNRRGSGRTESRIGKVLSRGANGVGKLASKGMNYVSEKHKSRVEANKRARAVRKQYKAVKANKIKNMSDEELNKAITRIKKEAEYRELTKTRADRMKESIGKSIKNAAKNAASKAVNAAIDSVIEGYKKDKELVNVLDMERRMKEDPNNLTSEELKTLATRSGQAAKYFENTKKIADARSGRSQNNKSSSGNNSEKPASTSSLESKVTSAIKSVPMDTSWQEYSRYSTKYVDASRYNLDNADYYRHKDWYDKHGEW